ncbi:MAG: GNAT family N-acetyltransferase [Bacteroidota bacterium]|nr:GNAT family N-acetyltransferase [Bacteroidota bacterium]
MELPVIQPDSEHGNEMFIVRVAEESDACYAQEICDEMEASAKVRGTGIAKRKPEYIIEKMREGKAVIATTTDGRFAGFCYIETWSGKEFVANSGLIVAPPFRHVGLAKRIKRRIFELSREKYPNAKIFGITTSQAVMKINTELGYVPVHFSELTQDDTFWEGCNSCPNVDILKRTQRKMCLCTGMLFDPNDPHPIVERVAEHLSPELAAQLLGEVPTNAESSDSQVVDKMQK